MREVERSAQQETDGNNGRPFQFMRRWSSPHSSEAQRPCHAEPVQNNGKREAGELAASLGPEQSAERRSAVRVDSQAHEKPRYPESRRREMMESEAGWRRPSGAGPFTGQGTCTLRELIRWRAGSCPASIPFGIDWS
jgi:hypothetical protein